MDGDLRGGLPSSNYSPPLIAKLQLVALRTCGPCTCQATRVERGEFGEINLIIWLIIEATAETNRACVSSEKPAWGPAALLTCQLRWPGGDAVACPPADIHADVPIDLPPNSSPASAA